MSLGQSSSAIHLSLPTHTNPVQGSPSTSATSPANPAPKAIYVHPVALFSILDHYLRRTPSQPRVIGTLLGSYTSQNTVNVTSSFAVLHSEGADQVAVDMEYHRTMFELHQRSGGKEVIVGWYSTTGGVEDLPSEGGEEDEDKRSGSLNTYSALIQNFYEQETSPNQAVHVSLNLGLDGKAEAGVSGYVSSPVGIQPKPENCVFVPIPVQLQFYESERSGIDLLASSSQPTAPPANTLETLSTTLHSIDTMLDRVLAYVRSVLSGEVKGDPAVGRYLMDTLGTSVEGTGEGGFNGRLQDTLMMSYLSSLIRSQAEVSSRLALVSGA